MSPPLVSIVVADLAPQMVPESAVSGSASSSQSVLLESIHSALEQTWPRCELLIIGPKVEACEAALQRRAKRHEITLIEAPTTSVVQALNIGIQNSSGELLQFLQPGELLAPEKISEQATLYGGGARDKRLALARHATFKDSPNDAEFSRIGIWCNRSALEWILDAWSQCYHPPLGAWCIPRSIVTDAGRFNESLGDPGLEEMLTRCILSAEGVDFASNAVVYRRQPAALVRTPAFFEQGAKAIATMVQWLLKVDDSRRAKKAAALLIEEFVYEALPYAPQAARSALASAENLEFGKFKRIPSRRFQVARSCLGWRSALFLRRWGLGT
jgi:hypothetical protein